MRRHLAVVATLALLAGCGSREEPQAQAPAPAPTPAAAAKPAGGAPADAPAQAPASDAKPADAAAAGAAPVAQPAAADAKPVEPQRIEAPAIAKVMPGMTEADVITLCGKPDRALQKGSAMRLIYDRAASEDSVHTIDLVDGVVRAIGSHDPTMSRKIAKIPEPTWRW